MSASLDYISTPLTQFMLKMVLSAQISAERYTKDVHLILSLECFQAVNNQSP